MIFNINPKFKKKNLQILLLILGIIIIIALLNLINLTTFYYKVVNNFILPLKQQTREFGQSVSEELSFLQYKKLYNDNHQLRAQLNTVFIDYEKLKSLENDYKALSELTKLSKPKNYNYIFTEVVGVSGVDNLATLIINKGSTDGLINGLAVVIPPTNTNFNITTYQGGIVIGKLIRVNKNTSEVRLLTHELSRISALILNQGGEAALGVISGSYGLSAKAELISKKNNIDINDLVITSGLEENVPKNLILGTVKSLPDITTDAWQSAVLELFYQPEFIRFLAVVAPRPNL